MSKFDFGNLGDKIMKDLGEKLVKEIKDKIKSKFPLATEYTVDFDASKNKVMVTGLTDEQLSEIDL